MALAIPLLLLGGCGSFGLRRSRPTTSASAPYGDGDRGTPGEANDPR